MYSTLLFFSMLRSHIGWSITPLLFFLAKKCIRFKIIIKDPSPRIPNGCEAMDGAALHGAQRGKPCYCPFRIKGAPTPTLGDVKPKQGKPCLLWYVRSIRCEP